MWASAVRVPSEDYDIRLGDMVVNKPADTLGGVIQYDFGKTVQEARFQRTGLGAIATLIARHMVEEPALSRYIGEMATKYSCL
jgi:hypothetical protein